MTTSSVFIDWEVGSWVTPAVSFPYAVDVVSILIVDDEGNEDDEEEYNDDYEDDDNDDGVDTAFNELL